MTGTKAIAAVRTRVPLLAVLLVLAGVATVLTTTATPAHALCQTPAEQGDWHNINSATSSVTRVTASLTSCGDQTQCDTDGHCSTTPTTYAVRVWGKCSPTDCDWGTVSAPGRNDGWILAKYKFSFKTSSVWLRAYPYSGRTYLRVYVDNRFNPGDGRANYVTDEWFVKS